MSRSPDLWVPFAFICLVLTAAVSLCCGRYGLAPDDVVAVLLHPLGLGGEPRDPAATAIMLELRIPRMVAAILIGAALAASGVTYQAAFRNPLVSPGLLGVLAGAGFGAAVAIVLGFSATFRMTLSFVVGGAAVGVGILIATTFGSTNLGRGDQGILLLVFGGLVSTALFTALLAMVKFIADPDGALPDIVFWLLGSLAEIRSATLVLMGPLLVIAIGLLLGNARFLDILVLSDDEALSLGVAAPKIRLFVIVIATISCALTVALAGTIGWVGLVIPHVARLLVGPAHSRLMPMAICLGGIFLLVCDLLARSVTVSEIPIGILTDLIGVIAFIAVLPRVRRWM